MLPVRFLVKIKKFTGNNRSIHFVNGAIMHVTEFGLPNYLVVYFTSVKYLVML